MTTPYARLSDLLRSMFDAAELRAFLNRLPQGSDLVDTLPEGRGIKLLAGDVVDVLQRRGRIDEKLFAELVSYTPDRYVEVADVAQAWGVVSLDRTHFERHETKTPLQTRSNNSSPFHGPVTSMSGQAGSSEEVRQLLKDRTVEDESGLDESGRRASSYIRNKGNTDVVILVALEEEFIQLCSLAPKMTPAPDVDYGGYDYQFTVGTPETGYNCVARLVGNMGPDRAGLFTDRLIARWSPAVVVMVGIAGGIHDDVRLSDVLVAEQVDAYLAEAKAVPKGTDGWGLQSRPRVFHGDHSLLQEAANLRFAHTSIYDAWRNDGSTDFRTQVEKDMRKQLVSEGLVEAKPNLLRGHIASGPVVVTAGAFADWIRSQDATIKAVEMEAAGLVEAAATRAQPMRALVIRGISDLGDERKSKLDAVGKGGLRRLAMRNATRLLFALMEARVLPRKSGQ